MTIENTVSQVVYEGDGSATVFPFEFLIPAGALVVELFNGITTVELEPPAYSVTGIGDPAGGSVTLASALAVGSELYITRRVAFVQEVDIGNQQKFFANVVEGALDYLTLQTQQLRTEITRAVLIRPGQDPQALLDTIVEAEANSAENATKAEINAAAAEGFSAQAAASAAQAADYPVPVGQMIVMPSIIPLPDGYIAAAGQSVNRDDAPKLFAAIGTEFGAGAGPGPTELLTNGDFTSGLDGWEAQTSGGAFVNANDRLEISGYVLLRQDFTSEGVKILTVDVFALDDASTPLRFFGFNPSTEETVLVAEITAAGVYRFFFPAGFDQLVLLSFSPQGDPHQVSSVSLEMGGTFAAPNPTAPAADTHWLIRKD